MNPRRAYILAKRKLWQSDMKAWMNMVRDNGALGREKTEAWGKVRRVDCPRSASKYTGGGKLK